MNKETAFAALLKWDLADWTQTANRLGEEQARECLIAVHNEIEVAVSGYSPAPDSFSFEGDGGKAYFTGRDASARAAQAGLQAIEKVRTLPCVEAHLRCSVGFAALDAATDLAKITPRDFNLAGHMVGGDVCPPNALCVTEDAYHGLQLQELRDRFTYLGTTSRVPGGAGRAPDLRTGKCPGCGRPVNLPSGTTYLLEPLQPEQTRAPAVTFYSEMFRSLRYGEKEALEKGEKKGGALVDALKQRRGVSVFAANPLLLTLAALVHIQLGGLPRHRVKLYDVACETLVEAWAKARRPEDSGEGDIHTLDYETEGRVLIPFLAYYLHENCPGGAISKFELERILRERVGESRSLSEFLEKLNQAGSLLVEKGPGEWGFIHQTFQEYLVAKYIASEDLHEDVLRKRLYHPRWEEVIRFTAGETSIVQGRNKAAANFIRSIFEDQSPEAKALKKNEVIGVKCYMDTTCSELEENVIAMLTKWIETAPPPPKFVVNNVLQDVAGTPLAGKAVPHFLELLNDEDSSVRRHAAKALGDLQAREAMPRLFEVANDEDRDVRETVVSILWEWQA